ncbi:MAG: hypothetical protein HY856_13945 [Burkholderiales bacterium]|nr:hypothetical protein [Burkholderiales bacterium]
MAAAVAPGPHYVVVESTHERLSPDPNGKSTNVIRVRQKVDVYEIKNGFARVSPFYDGAVEGVSGQVARWVAAKDLSVTRPADEKVAADEPPVAKVLLNSDDFARHRAAFIKASQKLLDDRVCTLKDFRDNGGWLKSTQQGKGIYFTYCGGSMKSDRLYLNVTTGRVYR